mmetsp:Transcript_49957/g.156374  ORF Transcript_49957/g.156374 Transcript_49957/m.156374 type:complete len:202 (-) Transcript_49957:1492-2097(-)
MFDLRNNTKDCWPHRPCDNQGKEVGISRKLESLAPGNERSANGLARGCEAWNPRARSCGVSRGVMSPCEREGDIGRRGGVSKELVDRKVAPRLKDFRSIREAEKSRPPPRTSAPSMCLVLSFESFPTPATVASRSKAEGEGRIGHFTTSFALALFVSASLAAVLHLVAEDACHPRATRDNLAFSSSSRERFLMALSLSSVQ